MTAGTTIVLADQHQAATTNGVPNVRVVTGDAGDLAFQHGVVIRKVELAAFIQVTREAHLRRPAGVHNGVRQTSALGMHAARTVTGFASASDRVRSSGHQPRMRGGAEPLGYLLVARRTIRRPNERGSRDLRRHYHGPVRFT